MGRSAPSKEDRDKCWAARDAYFECLNTNGLWLDRLAPQSSEEVIAIDPTTIMAKLQQEKHIDNKLRVCEAFRLAFEKECLNSWVKKIMSNALNCFNPLVFLQS